MLYFEFILLILCFVTLTYAFSPLTGITVRRVSDSTAVDLGETIKGAKGDTLLVLGTYAADFNMIEYAQRLRHYKEKLKAKGVANIYLVVNASPEAATSLAKLLDLPNTIELFADEFGKAGKAYGVSRGWRPDDLTNPYVKLFGMLWGLGAWATLPAVIGGYLGNPWSKQPWIEDALAQGQLSGRWPNNALEMKGSDIITNKFNELPYVGGWGRRPLELATLRLQNMIGVSLMNWNELKPSDEALENGVLTQLGGCLVITEGDAKVKYEWKDEGICHVANFEDILAKL